MPGSPAYPAPDHNLPGKLSKRSDRRFSAEGHGTRQQFEAFQDAAGGPPSPAAGAGGAPPSPGAPAPSNPTDPHGVFAPMDGPSAHPARPQQQIEPDDPDLALRALYAAYPHPDILFLLEQRRPR